MPGLQVILLTVIFHKIFFKYIYSMLLRTRSWRSTWVQRRTPRGNSLLRWENSEPANRDFTIIEFSYWQLPVARTDKPAQNPVSAACVFVCALCKEKQVHERHNTEPISQLWAHTLKLFPYQPTLISQRRKCSVSVKPPERPLFIH